jgi:hypothetical protein
MLYPTYSPKEAWITQGNSAQSMLWGCIPFKRKKLNARWRRNQKNGPAFGNDIVFVWNYWSHILSNKCGSKWYLVLPRQMPGGPSRKNTIRFFSWGFWMLEYSANHKFKARPNHSFCLYIVRKPTKKSLFWVCGLKLNFWIACFFVNLRARLWQDQWTSCKIENTREKTKKLIRTPAYKPQTDVMEWPPNGNFAKLFL